MDKYIAFDLETGGLNKSCSILTAYFVVLDSDLTTIHGELDLKIKPDKGENYSVTAEALGINGINIIEHDKTAVTLSEASKQLFEFVKKHSNSGELKLIPVGHNVYFDEEFIKEHMLSGPTWEQFVSYRRMDTGVIAQFLRLTNKIPKGTKGSLSSLASHYGVKLTNAHSAKDDTLATVKVLRKMLKTERQ